MPFSLFNGASYQQRKSNTSKTPDTSRKRRELCSVKTKSPMKSTVLFTKLGSIEICSDLTTIPSRDRKIYGPNNEIPNALALRRGISSIFTTSSSIILSFNNLRQLRQFHIRLLSTLSPWSTFTQNSSLLNCIEFSRRSVLVKKPPPKSTDLSYF